MAVGPPSEASSQKSQLEKVNIWSHSQAGAMEVHRKQALCHERGGLYGRNYRVGGKAVESLFLESCLKEPVIQPMKIPSNVLC